MCKKAVVVAYHKISRYLPADTEGLFPGAKAAGVTSIQYGDYSLELCLFSSIDLHGFVLD
jgi:hypothetical protein